MVHYIISISEHLSIKNYSSKFALPKSNLYQYVLSSVMRFLNKPLDGEKSKIIEYKFSVKRQSL